MCTDEGFDCILYLLSLYYSYYLFSTYFKILATPVSALDIKKSHRITYYTFDLETSNRRHRKLLYHRDLSPEDEKIIFNPA